MNRGPKIGLSECKGSTQYAPLVALGSYLRQEDLLSPLYRRVEFGTKQHTQRPLDALVDLWLSQLAGCRSVSQLNTKVRPDQTLAQSWGRTKGFAEQSTVARVLDGCQAEEVGQVRSASHALLRWWGSSYQQRGKPLLVDIDLTELPASRRGEGSTQGYFQEKGGADGSYVASV